MRMNSKLSSGPLTSAVVLIVILFTDCIGANPDVTTASPPPTPKAQVSNRFILDTASLDLNHDGCIDGKDELDAFKDHVASALAGTPSSVLRAHSIVYRTDVNRDGRICWCDFIAIYLHDKFQRNRHSVPFLVLPDNVMFTQLDDNGDGKLTGGEREKLQAEFASCLPLTQAQFIVNTMSGLMEKDDSISREEFQEYFNTPRAHQTDKPAEEEAHEKDH